MGEDWMGNTFHSYHFDLKKDRFLLWIFLLPIGLISWVLPFVLFWGLMDTGLEQDTSIVIAFLFLGLPAYLIGWIFVYSVMEGLITRVSFSDSKIFHRTPSLIFPLLWKTKIISISDIENINFQTPYGSRTAILLLAHRGNRIKKYFLPRFKNQPEYLQEFQAFSKERNVLIKNTQTQEKLSLETVTKEEMLATVNTDQLNLRGWDRFLKLIGGILICALILGSGFYCLQLPFSVFESFSTGASVGMILVLICLVLSFPIIGQVLIWFYAKKAIFFIFSFFNINSDSLFMPSTVQDILREWTKWDTAKLSLTDFTFWCVFLLSILYSVDRIIRRSNRRKKSRE